MRAKIEKRIKHLQKRIQAQKEWDENHLSISFPDWYSAGIIDEMKRTVKWLKRTLKENTCN